MSRSDKWANPTFTLAIKKVRWNMDEEEIKLTKKEERAIARLQKLANTWPQSLMLFSQSGDLIILKPSKEDNSGGLLRYEVGQVIGIPNDGGDADY